MLGGNDIKNIFADEVKEYIRKHKESDYQLIDVREPAEYTEGHIPGAKLIPLSELPQRISQVPSDIDLLFYCRSGKRSQMAASIVADSDIRTRNIYNIKGGILAWEGKPIEDFPRLKVFEGINDPEKILTLAIKLEKGAWIFYRAILEKYPDSRMAPAARSLEKLEKKHAMTIFNILQKRPLKNRMTEDFEEFFARMDGDIMEGGETVEEALAKIDRVGPDNCLSFGELALEIEYRAYDMYKNLYVDSSEDEEKEIYRDLAEQEKGHALVVARHISKCMD